MKCKTCEGDVPPKFAHAIATNICPFCGQEIMDSELQSALTELKQVMTASESYPEEIFDWLKCNFNLVLNEGLVPEEEYNGLEDQYETALEKITELQTQLANVKPTPRSGKAAMEKRNVEVDKDEEGNDIGGEVIQDQETTNKFFKNAQVKAPGDNASYYRDMVKQIKKTGTMGLMSEGGGTGMITPDMLDAVDSEEAAEYQAMLSGGSSFINSSVSSDDYGGDDEIPAVALAMMNRAKSSQGGDYNARDVAKLQELQKKASRVSREMNEGGGVGLIRR